MRVTVFNNRDKYTSIPDKPEDLIAFIKDLLDSVPDEFKDSARIEFDAYPEYDSAYLEVDFYYYRPETEEEIIAKEEAQRIKDIAELARAKRIYENIKARIGD